jgi:4-amino-4-deoxy-L-arabinose transferase-like glycosyltransferase
MIGPVSGRASIIGSTAILALLAVVAVRNAFSYPTRAGYDAPEYIAYARDLFERGDLPPEGTGAYYTPPGFPALAGAATKLGSTLGVDEPEHLAQLMNAIAIVVAGVLVFLLARILWPLRPLLWLAAVGFYAFVPTVVKTGAMFHPEPLEMLLTAAALVVLARMVRTGRYSWRHGVALGVLLGLGQLVRAWSLWVVVVSVVVLVMVAVTDRIARRSAISALGLAIVIAALVPAPWYAHQALHYSNPVFDQPQPDEFLLARRPLAFYVDARFPDLVTQPWRDRFNDRFLPVFYAETWGDYFGFWSWGSTRGDRTDAIDSELSRQSALGLLPTGLAVAGVIALLGLAVTRPREDPGRLVAALPPLAATGAVLYFAVAYPTNDGDTIKGTYAMAAVPALAVSFGFAFECLARRRAVLIVLGAALCVSALAMLPFLVW